MKILPPKNKTVLAVFAHPDDESFGPGGTIAKWSRENKIILLIATGGEYGQGSKKLGPEALRKIRKEETLKAANILGIEKVHFLGFEDGKLCNRLYHKLADKIKKYVKKYQPQIFLTFDTNGVSGHIDHIVVSLVTTYVFEKTDGAHQIFYYCSSSEITKRINDYFVYHPKGYERKDVDYIEDVRKFWKRKIEALLCHKSQENDVKKFLKTRKGLPKEEFFRIKTKTSRA